MGEVLTEKILDRINFSDSYVCHYRYRIINTEEKDGKLWLVSQEYEKGILNLVLPKSEVVEEDKIKTIKIS